MTNILTNYEIAVNFEAKNQKLSAKHYYLKSIKDDNNINAMFKLGKYYENTDTKLMIKYYKMAARLKCDESMFELAKYHKKTNNIKSMLKYYKMSAKLNNNKALNNLCLVLLECCKKKAM